MYKTVSRLLLYRDDAGNSILSRLSEIFQSRQGAGSDKTRLRADIYAQIKRIITLACDCDFPDINLWHGYLTYVLLTNENPFTLSSEMTGERDGTLKELAISDFEVFKDLFNFDFSSIEKDLNIRCFSQIADYRACPPIKKPPRAHIGRFVEAVCRQIESAESREDIFDILAKFYKSYGVGNFGLNRAFRIRTEGAVPQLCPVNNPNTAALDDIVGYERQKSELVRNTEAFIAGGRANNVLLYGDGGTGKSTSIKAIVNEYYDRGLRMIEIYKHQFKHLAEIISIIKYRNYRFIVYLDDLSFEEHETEYKFLKSIIEGGVETRPDNVLIYATSNRRHLIKETWSDRYDDGEGGDIHRSETVQEKLSLAHRFGISINYSTPTRSEYHSITKELAARSGIKMNEASLFALADEWEMSHGGISGRTARQFVDSLCAEQ